MCIGGRHPLSAEQWLGRCGRRLGSSVELRSGFFSSLSLYVFWPFHQLSAQKSLVRAIQSRYSCHTAAGGSPVSQFASL